MTRLSSRHAPVAIGGIGGSGTRLGSALLQELGFYIGDDLNPMLDNLWFTLLFKRRSVLTLTDAEFGDLVELFVSRMAGARAFDDGQRALISDLASDDRPQHDRSWLSARVETFLSKGPSGAGDRPWGWKEPNTHVVIDRLFETIHGLRYIQFERHPLDMAFSSNQNQLQFWGGMYLNRQIEMTPESSLAYWCVAHRKSLDVMQRHPGRVLRVDFDELRAQPRRGAAAIAAFLGDELSAEGAANFERLVQQGTPDAGRFRRMDLTQFDPQNIAYVASLGYDVTPEGVGS